MLGVNCWRISEMLAAAAAAAAELDYCLDRPRRSY